VKASALVAVPAAVVTLIGPLIADAGTVTLIEVDERTVKGAVVLAPLNLTDCTELNPEPVIVTVAPAAADAGEKLVITGKTVKLDLLNMTVGLVERVMLIKPVVAPSGTVALICLLETIVKLVAATLLNFTAVAISKPEPEIVTTVPAAPLVGENSPMPGKTVKLVALVAAPAGPFTLIGPVIAPAGTVAFINVAETNVTAFEEMAPPLGAVNCTAVSWVKLLPEIDMSVPGLPLGGVKLVIFGSTVKVSALVLLPAAVVTIIGPLFAKIGTVALIEVEERIVKGALTSTPLNFTDCTELNPEPVIVTVVPAAPLVGERPVITGKTVKLVLLVMTVGLVERVMLIKPVVAPAGKIVLILLSDSIVKLVAGTLLNFTPVAELKPDPEIVTAVPAVPLDGENSLMPGKTVKLVAVVAVPAGVLTLIGPVIVPAGTVTSNINVAVISVAVLDGTVVPFGPANNTLVSLVKPLPEIDMKVPGLPLVGVKLFIFGSTVKVSALVPVPVAVVTLIGPLTAVVGTVALIEVELITVKVLDTPPNLTDETATKVLPVIVTVAPAVPLAGVKLSTLGKTLKLAALMRVPVGVIT
jgi:hypothetical protein